MTNASAVSPQDDRFRRMLGLSVGAHVFIFLFFVVRLSLFPPEPLEFQAAIRVDMVSLPDKVITQALSEQAKQPEVARPKPEVNPVPKPEPKPAEKKAEEKPKEQAKPKEPPKSKVNLEKPKPDLKALKKEEQKAMEKLKAMEAVDEIMHEENKPKPKPVVKTTPASTVTKGNVLSAGSALKGLNKLDYDQYLGDLDQHVKSNWNLPEWLAKIDLKARAVVYLDAQGVVIGRKLVLASGNPQFDAYVLKAIDDSSPFPKPPEKFAGMLKTNGIVFGFPD